MELSGATKAFAVLGHPIGHTLSPLMHGASFRALKLDAVYLAFDVAPDRLLPVLAAMRDMGFGGVNLTVPLKEVACRELPELALSAHRLGAVNTVEFPPGGGMRGHNTDGDGFVMAVAEAFGVVVKGLSVFVLGCGGAGRAVALTCAAEGARRVAVADADAARSARLAGEMGRARAGVAAAALPAEPSAWVAAAAEADLVVQATPVGMNRGDSSLLGAEAFHEDQMVFDLVYQHPQTSFMRAALAAGARTANGLGMLLHQGAKAFEIWTGRAAAVDVMRRALEERVYGKGGADGHG